MVEVSGMAAAISAADAAVKSAPVRVAWLRRVGGGLVAFGLVGDVASVQAAIDAARSACSALGIRATTSVIGRPALPGGPTAQPLEGDPG